MRVMLQSAMPLDKQRVDDFKVEFSAASHRRLGRGRPGVLRKTLGVLSLGMAMLATAVALPTQQEQQKPPSLGRTAATSGATAQVLEQPKRDEFIHSAATPPKTDVIKPAGAAPSPVLLPSERFQAFKTLPTLPRTPKGRVLLTPEEAMLRIAESAPGIIFVEDHSFNPKHVTNFFPVLKRAKTRLGFVEFVASRHNATPLAYFNNKAPFEDVLKAIDTRGFESSQYGQLFSAAKPNGMLVLGMDLMPNESTLPRLEGSNPHWVRTVMTESDKHLKPGERIFVWGGRQHIGRAIDEPNAPGIDETLTALPTVYMAEMPVLEGTKPADYPQPWVREGSVETHAKTGKPRYDYVFHYPKVLEPRVYDFYNDYEGPRFLKRPED